MEDRLRVAVVGVARIGSYHARNVQDIAATTGGCRLAAVVDAHGDTAARVATRLAEGRSEPVRAFPTPEALIEAGIADAVIVASRTEDHEAHTRRLVDAGLRVLLEKPLADTLSEAERLCAWLDADADRACAVMLAFQRRYDPAMLRARALLRDGMIGELFKIVSVLEDPAPPPAGYCSAGLLTDMAVHNVDEVLWLSERRPTEVAGFGARLHNQLIPDVAVEDYDDALLQMTLEGGCIARLTVSRNHVAGYRNECVLYGRRGRIHVGHFEGDPHTVRLEAHGPGHAPIAEESFALAECDPHVPVFVQRFGGAYRAEVAKFIERCRSREVFAVTHREGLAAMRVVATGQNALEEGRPIRL